MATVYVRNVPDKIYPRIKTFAEQKNRSISADYVALS